MSNIHQSKKIKLVAKSSKPRGREITLNVCQGIGDIIWVYQKFCQHFDKIHFNIFVLPSGEIDIQSRAEPFLRVLPKAGRVTYEVVDLDTFQKMVAIKVPMDDIIKEWEQNKHKKITYACNKPLEEGIRLENIDPQYETLETIPFNKTSFHPLSQKDYIVLYVSGAIKNLDVLKKGAWTLDMWETFMIRFYERFKLTCPTIIIGANFDSHIQKELSERLFARNIENHLYTNLDPEYVIDIIQKSIAYIGYQSGLSIIADILDVKQVMLYYSWLEGLMHSWPKNKNISSNVYNAFLWSVSPNEVVQALPDNFITKQYKLREKTSIQICRKSVDPSQYVIAKYHIESKTTVWEAAYNIAVGQSVGNPLIRNSWESDSLYENHSCKIIDNSTIHNKCGEVSIAYPIANINWKEDGISQLMCFLMGGHLDIDLIQSCQLIDINVDSIPLFKPKFGISGIREFTGVYDKPLLGGIIKPKTGLSPEQLLEVVKQLVEGGVNFIKEDEILGNPDCCRLERRLQVIQPYLNNKKVVYCYCINGDYPYCIDRAKMVADAGGNGVHINIWNGLGVYKSLRELDLPIYIHFQKSGDRIFTNPSHAHHISWNAVCKLAALMGVDSIHAGMWGGYSNNEKEDLKQSLDILRSKNVMPALSCGMHPGLVNKITKIFGVDYLANVGGAIHGHPGGTLAGTKAMRQAIDGDGFGDEYYKAIKTWGLQCKS